MNGPLLYVILLHVHTFSELLEGSCCKIERFQIILFQKCISKAMFHDFLFQIVIIDNFLRIVNYFNLKLLRSTLQDILDIVKYLVFAQYILPTNLRLSNTRHKWFL